MALAPQLDPLDLVSSAEVVTVAVLAEPPPLAGCLTGLSASERGTVALAIFGARIGNEQLGATAAFASGLRAAHREPDPGEQRVGRKPKRRTGRKRNPKKEGKF